MSSNDTAIPIFKKRHDTHEFSPTESAEIRKEVAEALLQVQAAEAH